MYTRQIKSNLCKMRRERGISAIALAEAVGVSRQTIYAIEAGSFIPNTVVALHLACVLAVSVEELFAVRGSKSRPDGNTILLAGCDPAVSLLARHLDASGIELISEQRNSSQALTLLEEGQVHVAGTHLKDEVGRRFTPKSVAVISFAMWEEGIVTARGNPKSIKDTADMSRKDVTIVNRETGSGSRALLDRQLQLYGIETESTRGYQTLASGHLAAAWHVYSGAADCCVATRAAARAFRLHFLPLENERYDLVIRKRHLESPRIQKLLETLSRAAFRRDLKDLGGYDTRVTGQRVL